MNETKIRILCIGEAMLELQNLNVGSQSAQIGVAGDTLNTAIYMKRLLKERADVFYLTVLGTDEVSDQIKKYIQSQGIRTESIRHTRARIPGIYSINLNRNGERSFNYWRNRSAAKDLFKADKDFSAMDNFDLIYYSGITLSILPEKVRNTFLKRLKNRNKKTLVAFDSNFRPTLWRTKADALVWTNKAWGNCDIALPSIDDEMSLLGLSEEESVINYFSGYGASCVVFKRGIDGPLLLGEKKKRIFSKVINAVDTTAAGDSFNAGFLSSMVIGNSREYSIKVGHNIATIVINHQGAIIPESELKKLRLD